jgi:hypothetical protein
MRANNFFSFSFVLKQKKQKFKKRSSAYTQSRLCPRYLFWPTRLSEFGAVRWVSTKRANCKLLGTEAMASATRASLLLVFVVSFSLFLSFGQAKERKMLNSFTGYKS